MRKRRGVSTKEFLNSDFGENLNTGMPVKFEEQPDQVNMDRLNNDITKTKTAQQHKSEGKSRAVIVFEFFLFSN